MAVMRDVKPKGTIMGKLGYGSDLLEELTGICRGKGIKLGRIEVIGAVQKACIGFYRQEKREYKFITFDRGMEIVSLIGNISTREGEPMVHAHMSIADQNGTLYGGHLAAGTIVFAGEFVIEVYDGPMFERGFDHNTGLPLWEMEG